MATTVDFGSYPATNVVVVSDTEITCTTAEASAAGAVSVVVRTANGASATGPATTFTYQNVGITITSSNGGAESWTQGTLITPITFSATGGIGTIVWSNTGLPAGVTQSSSSGTISGTPTNSGFVSPVGVTATDSEGNFNQLIIGPISVSSGSTGVTPLGPSGTWTLAWNDEFDDTTGMSGPDNGLNLYKWNGGWDYGPTSPGQPGRNVVATGINTHDADYHGPGCIVFESDGLHLRGTSPGPDTNTAGGESAGSTYECGAIWTAGLMSLNPLNVGGFSTELQDAINAGQTAMINGTIVIEAKVRIPGPNTLTRADLWWQDIWWLGNAGNFNGWGASFPGGVGYLKELDGWEWYQNFEFPPGQLGGAASLGFPTSNEDDIWTPVPISMADTDMSLELHTYTMMIENVGGTLSLYTWVDGVPGLSPTASSAQLGEYSGSYAALQSYLAAVFEYPMWIGLLIQARNASDAGTSGYPPNTATTPTETEGNDLIYQYFRVFTPA